MSHPRRPRPRERGYSLIIAVSIIALLIMMGTMVLDQVGNDVQLAGGDRAAQNAMFLAEAGAIWGKSAVVQALYPTSDTATAQLTAITSLPALTAVDALCPDGISCASWYRLTAAEWVTYANGQYRVGVTCNPSCSGTPQSYTIRSLGKSADGAQRLIEVVVGP
ncbi:MAG TPA: hypothetical protein VFH51_00825 [Myxococcota bacterium]|nr:hypothetical protein [Myxococcota bacterium]